MYEHIFSTGIVMLVNSKETCTGQTSARGRRPAPKRGRLQRSKSAPAIIMSDITNKRK